MNADRVTIRMGGDLTIVRISQVFAHFTEVLKSLDETYGANRGRRRGNEILRNCEGPCGDPIP